MTVKDLHKVLNNLTPETEINISIDISTGEKDSFKRAFSTEYLEYIDDGTLIFSGYVNED